ncbi:Golgi CORVET complex core vacuolar protein 8-domain-containing protein [Spinellus fusiger]|nr:Golgi CORVET complex core vacuolar protein 8-domain-containing protein [Spinellus fusiger]
MDSLDDTQQRHSALDTQTTPETPEATAADGQSLSLPSYNDTLHPHRLVVPKMERSSSTNTLRFRTNYDELLKEVLEESSEDEEELLNHIDIDLTTATAELPDELRAALEDRSLADKYLANLKTFMSHRRAHSYGSMTNGKGDFSSPTTPLQTSFAQPMSPKPFFRVQQDPLSKLLEDVPYQTRLVNGVESLTVLEQKFHALRILELDLPTVSDTVIKARLDALYKIQDDLYIHLHGGPLTKHTHSVQNIGEKKKYKVKQLLDEIAREIGLYEEFVKRASYLCLESILNASDSSGEEDQGSELFETDTSGVHFDSSSDISRLSPGTPASPIIHASTLNLSQGSNVTLSTPPHRTLSQTHLMSSADRGTHANHTLYRLGSSTGGSSTSHVSSEAGSLDEHSPSLSVLMNDPGVSHNESKDSVEPWEAFKWTPLLKISEQLYSDSVRKNSGLLTVLVVGGVIAIGTTRSLVFVYDYSQQLICVLGDSARAVEVGSVTSLAISADHTTIACGYSQGYIIVWNIKKPGHPVRTIEPIPSSQLSSALSTATGPQQPLLKKEGHVKGAAILHIGFIGIKKSEIVSGDDQGMSFYHVLYKVVMVNAVDTTRILGRYQNIKFSPDAHASPRSYQYSSPASDEQSIFPKLKRPSTVFAMQPLPLGHMPHPAETFGLVALLTPYKMIVVGLKPIPQTQYKYLKPKTLHVPGVAVDKDGLEAQETQREDHTIPRSTTDSLSGCLAWLPVTKTGTQQEKEISKVKDTLPSTDPMLAFSWGNNLFIIRVGVETPDTKLQTSTRTGRPSITAKSKKGSKLEFVKLGEWRCRDPIVSIQWINRQILVLLTPNEEMILFDPKNMKETERASIRSKQLVYHDWFNSSLKDLANEPATSNLQPAALATGPAQSTSKDIEMAYYHSLKGYKGRLFLLGLRQLFVGTLLSWADRILALVKAGDFLEGIELATLFYNGRRIQTVVGLPEDEQERKYIVGEKLMELLVASLNYAFSSKRTYEGMTDDISGGNSILYRNLADGCIKACLSMGKLEFLFDTVYERFADSSVRGVFLEVLEPYIVQDQMSEIPPGIMKDLVEHYGERKLLSQLEQVIWHVNPHSLSIDQIVSMCHREGLYEAMMYVWNRSMNDYVSPVVEMLKVIRHILRMEGRRSLEESYSTQRLRVPTGESSVWSTQVPEENMRCNAEKLFDYFKTVLRGRVFPDGFQMVGARATEAKSAVYSFIFSGRCVVWPRSGGKLVLTADEEEEMSEPTYPYLRLLLRFNTKKFLEALEVVFEDPWLNGGEDILTSTFEDEMQGKVISRQIIINTLLDVMGGGLSVNGLSSLPPRPPPNPKQSISASTVQSFSMKGPNTVSRGMGYDSETSALSEDASSDNLVQLYMFIATNLHKYTTFILLPPKTLHKILVRLTEESSSDTRNERQKAIQNLLTIYTPANEDQMTLLYEEAGFWKVLETVYRRDKKYGKLVEAFLKDDERRNMVFDCVHTLLRDRSDLNSKQKNEVKSIIMIRISQFVEINGEKTAKIVEKFFNNDHESAIRRLEEDQEFEEEDHHAIVDKRLFLYLRGLLEPINSGRSFPEKYPHTLYDENSGMEYQSTLPYVDISIQERYIELMCRFDPSGVYDYLGTKLDSNMPMDTILKSCENHGIIDAVVWIMEKKGDTRGALDKMLEVAKEKNALILEIIKSHTQDKTLHGTTRSQNLWTFEHQSIISSCLVGLNGVLRVGTRLCENCSRMSLSTYVTESSDDWDTTESASIENSHTDNEDNKQELPDEEGNITTQRPVPENDEVELLWFRLLDAYVESSIEVYGALGSVSNHTTINIPQGLHQHIVSSFKSHVQSILASLLLSTSPQVSLPRLLLRLIHSQTRGETTFADFRDIFLSMLDTYKYEGKLLKMTNQLFDRDLYSSVKEMVRKKGRGWRPRRAICEICYAPVLHLSLLQKPLAWGWDDDEEEEKVKQSKVEIETESKAGTEAESKTDSNEVETLKTSVTKSELKDAVVFQCGHTYHRQCIELQTGTTQYVCTECHNGVMKETSQRKSKGKGKAA